jgi:hypothetical protein
MTDAGAPYLPGKPIGYGMNPGMHHNVMTGQDDYATPENPLDAPEPGAQPGPAPAAAGPPSPEAAPAPEMPHPFTPPVGSESKGPIVGWRVRDKEGHVVAELHNVNTSEWQKSQIDSVGKSLLDQAITPDDKESAQRARAYALSLVGIVPLEKITKTMLQLYENDQRNLTSRSIQAEKSKRAAMRGVGGPAVGPTKADKFQVGLDKELRSTVDGVIESERKDSKHAALAQLDNDVSEMESLLSAPNAMAQRVAVQKALLALTGKASRESEQAALTGASGKWEEFKNKISLWTSDDPQLGAKYIQEFKQMLRVQRQYVNQQRQMAGKAAAERVRAETFGYPDDQRQLAYDIAYGAMTGQYAGAASAPVPKAAKPPVAAPKGGGFDPDL